MITPITDERLRIACDRLALNPLGIIDAELPEDMARDLKNTQMDESPKLEEARCYDFVVSGEWTPDPGPLGFALGHPSPGWAWLRGLVDHVAVALEGFRFDQAGPDDLDDFYKEQAHLRAALLSWGEALIVVADLEISGNGVETDEYTESSMKTRTRFTDVAFDLVEYAGFLVCRELFTESVGSAKRKR